MTNSRHAVAVILATALLMGCSREKIDWKSAEAADTVEAYDHFLGRHPDGELSTQARARVAQLNEDRDWKRASAADTLAAYKQFLTQHENGKWAGEARIRVENFALDGTATGPLRPTMEAESTPAARSASAAELPKPSAAGPAADSPAVSGAAPAASTATRATPDAPVPEASASAARAAVPAASTRTTAPSPSASATQFGIQLGAFRSQQAALADWKRIQTRFNSDLQGLFAHAVPFQQASGQLFRLQAPVGDEARARSICASLTKQSQPCVVVLPQPR